jgi:DNA-binding IclR family transcriptional regulator
MVAMTDPPTGSKGTPDTPSGRVQAVDRAARLLAAVSAASPRGDTLANLALACRLNRATAWRLLSTLEANGLVDRDPGTNRYQLGFTVVRMAASAGYGGLPRRSRPVLERVCAEVGESTALAVAGRRGVVYVDEVAPASVLTVNWVSREVPLHATSTGKALLAWLPEPEVRDLLVLPLERFTDATVTDPRRLAEDLAATRTRGYASCAGELEPTLNGVSAPVRDPLDGRPAAVLSIWGPLDRVPVSRFEDLGRAAVAAATEVAVLVAGMSPAVPS